jgi:hypothetical protein
MTSQQFETPTEITFRISHVKNGKITRNHEEEYVNITQVIRGNKSKQLLSFKEDQKEDIAKLEKELGKPVFKAGSITGDKRSTYIHEKFLERILRWYEMDEKLIIDKFVRHDTREIGSYNYSDFNILIHLETKYINASHMCKTFGNKDLADWMDNKSTKELFEIYAKMESIPVENIVKKKLGNYVKNSWIPRKLVQSLAMWCSSEYYYYACEILDLFQNDPMKLVALAIKEHDRQTGQHTVAIIASTDNKEEYEQRVQFLEDQLKAYAEKLVSKDNQLVLATNKYELVKLEKNMVEFDLIGLKDDTKMYRNVLNDWGGDNIALDGQLRLTSEVLSNQEEKYSYQIEELNTWVQKLKDELTLERAEKSQLVDELNIAQAENETLMEEKDNLDEYEEEMAIEQSKKKRAPRGTSTASTASKSKTAKPKAPKKQKGKESSGAMYEPLILKDPKDKSISISIYTKIDLDGISCIYAPGKLVKSYQSKMNYQHRGSAQLANVKGTSASEYLDNFIEENPTAFISHSGYEFMVEKNETFERKFNEFFKDVILKKILSSGYPARASECLTSF